MDLLAFAEKIAARIQTEAARVNVPVGICLMDVHGNAILMHRMNGAPVFSIEVSERKAYTAALVGIRTAELFPRVQPGEELFPLMGLSGGRFCSMGGGAPLTIDGQRVAGVGISGGTVEQDVGILEAALAEARVSRASFCDVTDKTTNLKEMKMNTKELHADPTTVDMKLEVVVIPVTNVDRAKRFYTDLGWRLDVDYAEGNDYRVIQFTPPGSGCSIIFGTNVTTAAPGSMTGLHLIVTDIEATRAGLIKRGIAVSEPFHDIGGIFHHANGRDVARGPNPERKSYASYASFSDPDGNSWVFQEVTARLTGHIEAGDTSFTPQLTDFVRRQTAKAI
jgi:uncharacterized protein GlcG (DUF336 family)/catechol 2,3-dioxygenase-like lactoylglutathione lyase family enzyme